MNKEERMYQRIREHGENLKTIFGLHESCDPVKLCKKLRALENKATILTEDECNTGNMHANKLSSILDKVKKILFPEYKIKSGEYKLANLN